MKIQRIRERMHRPGRLVHPVDDVRIEREFVVDADDVTPAVELKRSTGTEVSDGHPLKRTSG